MMVKLLKEKIKTFIKSEVCKQSLHYRQKYITTLQARGKVFISDNENNKHVDKLLHRSFNKRLFNFYFKDC